MPALPLTRWYLAAGATGCSVLSSPASSRKSTRRRVEAMATIAALSFDREALAPSCRPLPSRWLVVLLFCCVGVLRGYAEEDASGFGGPNTVIISSVYYPQMQLKPFQWNYIRVELPAWFSSISLGLETNLHIDIEELRGLPMSKLPLICYQNGRPPLPDAPSSDLNPGALDLFHEEAIVNGLNKSGMEHCFFFQRDMVVTLTNEQVVDKVYTHTHKAHEQMNRLQSCR